ncbi:MAG: hypothetical protein IJZ78_01555 [Alistipes sp.]|nr:hypothetical protein [Alistipes sp.]
MKSLVSPEVVVSVAFAADYEVTSSNITTLDVLATESRFLLPLLGAALYDKLLGGGYPELLSDYVVPQVAAWTRYAVEPLLAERFDFDRSKDYSEADYSMNRQLLMQLRSTAQAMSRRLTDYLNANAESIPEYDADANPLNHCIMYGDVVQVY